MSRLHYTGCRSLSFRGSIWQRPPHTSVGNQVPNIEASRCVPVVRHHSSFPPRDLRNGGALVLRTSKRISCTSDDINTRMWNGRVSPPRLH